MFNGQNKVYRLFIKLLSKLLNTLNNLNGPNSRKIELFTLNKNLSNYLFIISNLLSLYL